jgi:pimeloyl-ACP methyl ester carboxylesterase
MTSYSEPIASPTTTRLRCNGLTFPVLIWGSEGGRPVLLLHGFPQEPSTWAQIADALAAEGFQAFAPFQRGYVADTRLGQKTNYTFMQFVEDAIGIADSLHLKRFDVIGFGMGGLQAWMLTAHWPTRIRSLTSLRFPHPAAFAHGIQLDPEQREKWRQLQEAFGSEDFGERVATMLVNDAARLRDFLTEIDLPQPYLDRYLERLKEPDALAGALSWEHAISLEEISRVPAIATPTLLLWSDGPGVARTTVQATRDYVHAPYREVLIPNTGNFMLERSSDLLIAPMREHLRST